VTSPSETVTSLEVEMASDDLRAFSTTFADLADDEVTNAAWLTPRGDDD
jgi:hypothetical protein